MMPLPSDSLKSLITCFPLSIRWLEQSAHWRRPAEQLDMMPFPSDSLKSLITCFPLSIRWLEQSAHWRRPAEQLDMMPFPSDSLKSLITCFPLSIRWLEQSAHWRRPAEQLDMMPFPSDSLKSLAFLCPSDGWSNQRNGGGQQSNLILCLFHQILSNHLLSFVHQMAGAISALEEASRAT